MPAKSTRQVWSAIRSSKVRAAGLLILATLVVTGFGADQSPTAEELAARRADVAKMDPNEQQELLRRYERFKALPAQEQERLRALDSQIASDEHSQRLHQILEQYHEWLKTLTPTQRAELAELSPTERVKAIKRIQRDQSLQILSRRDTVEIMRWIDGIVAKHRQELIASMRPEHRERFEKQQDPARQRHVLMYMAFGGRRDKDSRSRISQEDLDRLAGKLSEAARAELAKASTLEAKRDVVGGWIAATTRRSEARAPRRRMNSLVVEELLQFLQNEVPPDQQARLLKLEREEMLKELGRMYFERGHGDRRFPGGPPNFDPGFEGNFERGRGNRGRGDGRPRGDVNKKQATAPEKPEPAPDETPAGKAADPPPSP